MIKWEMVSIPDVAFFQEGPGVRNTQYTNQGIKLLNVANLQNGKLDLSTTDRYISETEAFGRYKHFLVDDGDFIIASSGIQVEYFDEKMGFADESQLPLCMNTSTIRFKSLDSNKLYIRYFMYFLKTPSFKVQLRKFITGSAQLNFGPSHIKKMLIPLPPIAVQHQIANMLDRASTLIEKRKAQMDKLDLLIKSQFNKVFNDPIKGPSKWTLVKLGDSAEIVSGSTPKTNVAENWDGNHKWITPAELKDDAVYILDSQRHLTDVGIRSAGLKSFPAGTVILSSRAPIGKVAIAGDEMYCNQGFKNIVCSDKISPIFLYWVLKQNTDYLNSLGRGATFKEISKKIVENIEISLPPISLQDQFAEFVHQVEAQKYLLQHSLFKLEQNYKSLMQKCFRGEVLS